MQVVLTFQTPNVKFIEGKYKIIIFKLDERSLLSIERQEGDYVNHYYG